MAAAASGPNRCGPGSAQAILPPSTGGRAGALAAFHEIATSERSARLGPARALVAVSEQLAIAVMNGCCRGSHQVFH